MTLMADALIKLERPQHGMALVTLNRPEAMNALSMALRAELTDTLDRLGAEEELRVIVLTGAGRAFCAGVDLRELAALATGEEHSPLADPGLDVAAAVARFRGVVIGAINGSAVTGGLELALACDILIASTEARFADTHARVGVMPVWGLSQRLPRIIGAARAKEMSLTGNFIDARRARAWGLVNRVVPPSQLLPEALALAADMVEIPATLLRRYKRLINDGLATTLEEGLRLEAANGVQWHEPVSAAEFEARRRALQSRGREKP